MRNNYGIGRFEILTVIVVLLGIFVYLGYTFLGGTTSYKLSAMTDSAVNLSKAVTVNISSFHNTENVYLGEAIDEAIIKKIKNPVQKGFCSESESMVRLVDDLPTVTLRCGKYLLEDYSVKSKKAEFYQVSDWSEKELENDSVEEVTLYNCVKNGKELFNEYYEELYFVYLVNKEFQTDYYFANNVNKDNCEVVSKVFYRTKELVK